MLNGFFLLNGIIFKHFLNRRQFFFFIEMFIINLQNELIKNFKKFFQKIL